MDDRDDICSLLSHVHKISSYSVGELDCIDDTGRTNDIRYVGDGCAGCGTEIEDLRSRNDSSFGDTSDD
jgi:hypothetical protein